MCGCKPQALLHWKHQQMVTKFNWAMMKKRNPHIKWSELPCINARKTIWIREYNLKSSSKGRRIGFSQYPLRGRELFELESLFAKNGDYN